MRSSCRKVVPVFMAPMCRKTVGERKRARIAPGPRGHTRVRLQDGRLLPGSGEAVGTVLCTVSTVKDTRANVEQFVERNLRSGADHMFVFLEADEDGTLAFLRENPHVTAVRTDDAYWVGER